MKALHAVIHGRVQGVWFRASTREQARMMGVSGWVRNTEGGDVEVFMQGNDDDVDRLLAWCRQGPPGARVDGIDFDENEPDESLKGFSVLY